MSAAERLLHALLPRLAEDGRDARVRVLHVVDRVVLRLAARQLQVDLERRVGAARGQEPARRVDADLVEQVVERGDLAGALRHRPAVAALGEADQLHDDDLVGARIAAQQLPRELHARHVAVMVGPPDVDRPVVVAADLVHVVGDVRGEVGPFAGRAPQDAVLVVAVGARAQPQRAVVLVDVRSSRSMAACTSPLSCSVRSEKNWSMSTRKRVSVARTPSSISSMPVRASSSGSASAAPSIRCGEFDDVLARGSRRRAAPRHGRAP